MAICSHRNKQVAYSIVWVLLDLKEKKKKRDIRIRGMYHTLKAQNRYIK